MKIIPVIFFFLTSIGFYQTISAQCQVVEELNFPYEKGLEMTLRGKTVKYDNYNFPLKTLDYSVHYSVKSNTLSSKGNAAVFEINTVVDKDTTLRHFRSNLYINAKGMSWTASDNGKGKLTQAIELPLQKGKRWYTDYQGNQKNRMTCVSMDSTFTLYLGKVRGFGIMYEVAMGRDERFDYFEEYYEWYNNHLGKIALFVKRYGVERETGRQFVMYTEEAKLEYTNLPEEKIKEALRECR